MLQAGPYAAASMSVLGVGMKFSSSLMSGLYSATEEAPDAGLTRAWINLSEVSVTVWP